MYNVEIDVLLTDALIIECQSSPWGQVSQSTKLHWNDWNAMLIQSQSQIL